MKDIDDMTNLPDGLQEAIEIAESGRMLFIEDYSKVLVQLYNYRRLANALNLKRIIDEVNLAEKGEV